MNGQVIAAIAALAAKLTANDMQRFTTCAIGEGKRARLIQGSLHDIISGFEHAATACGIEREDALSLYSGRDDRDGEVDGSVVVERTRHFLDRVVAMG